LASGAGVVLQSRHAITVRHKRLADEVNVQWTGNYRLREAQERKAAPERVGGRGRALGNGGFFYRHGRALWLIPGREWRLTGRS
jgi:hypothetical protein